MSRSVPQVATTLEPESPLAAQSAIQVDKEALEDARLRSVWESTMTVATGQPHLDAHVLMLSWEEEWDDLNTDPEVKELANVFCEKFNYKVERKKIKKDGTRPQLQVMLALAQFVHDHDRPGALLIVYYAGHGIAGKPGQLQFQPYVVQLLFKDLKTNSFRGQENVDNRQESYPRTKWRFLGPGRAQHQDHRSRHTDDSGLLLRWEPCVLLRTSALPNSQFRGPCSYR
jgi:hypothetical protein